MNFASLRRFLVHDHDMKLPYAMLFGGCNHLITNQFFDFLSQFKLGCSPKEFNHS